MFSNNIGAAKLLRWHTARDANGGSKHIYNTPFSLVEGYVYVPDAYFFNDNTKVLATFTDQYGTDRERSFDNVTDARNWVENRLIACIRKVRRTAHATNTMLGVTNANQSH